VTALGKLLQSTQKSAPEIPGTNAPVSKKSVKKGNAPASSGAFSARGANPPREVVANAFDGNEKTKWLVFPPEGGWLQRISDKGEIVTGYPQFKSAELEFESPKKAV